MAGNQLIFPMNFKAICTDIDGTLLNSERSLSPNLISIVSSISKEIPFFLASARMPAAMRHLLQDLNRPNEPLIAYNGALVLDGHGKVLESIAIPIPVVEQVVLMANSLQLHTSLLYGEEWHTRNEDYFAIREIKNTKVVPSWTDPLLVIERWKSNRHGAHKAMCMGDSPKIDLLYRTLKENLGGQLHLYRSKDTYLEIAPKPISKATGLKKILEVNYPGIGMHEVVAFGDGYNDIELLQQAGWGVAVENAFTEVKAVANEVTKHHKEDGVASTLTRIFLDKK